MPDWGALCRAADAQRDLLTRARCHAGGLTDDTLRWRVDSGRWQRLHEGVYVEVDGRGGHECWTDRVRDGQRDRPGRHRRGPHRPGVLAGDPPTEMPGAGGVRAPGLA